MDARFRSRQPYKLSPEAVKFILTSTLPKAQLASLFSVHPDTIRSVLTGRTWGTYLTEEQKRLDGLAKEGQSTDSINGDINSPINLPENPHD